MKVAILYLATGRYDCFWHRFYESSKRRFLPDVSKEYFVFTDSKALNQQYGNDPGVHFFEQEKLKWPYSTMLRFEIFLRAKDLLKAFDYIVFFNANLRFLKPIFAEEFLPSSSENLLVCRHPYHYKGDPDKFPYCRNPQTLAYIPFGKGMYYGQGALEGGRAIAFLEACEMMSRWTRVDMEKQVCPVWHDESYWNKYILDRQDIKVLSPSYLYPQGIYLPFAKKIEIINKRLYLGIDYLRGFRDTPESTLKLYIKNYWRLFKKLVLRKAD